MKAEGVATCGIISQKIEFFMVEYVVYLFLVYLTLQCRSQYLIPEGFKSHAAVVRI
jgi:hypothetical protein